MGNKGDKKVNKKKTIITKHKCTCTYVELLGEINNGSIHIIYHLNHIYSK